MGIATAANVFIATGARFPDVLTASPAAITGKGPADVEALKPCGLD